MWNQISTENNASDVKVFFQMIYHDSVNVYFLLVSTHMAHQFFIRLWSYPFHPCPVWANHQNVASQTMTRWNTTMMVAQRWPTKEKNRLLHREFFDNIPYIYIYTFKVWDYFITGWKAPKASLKWHPINLRLLKLSIWWRKWPGLLSLEAVNVICTVQSIMSYHRTCKHEHWW